jgi:YebC/PmpR family DNA-binding regulatory protein
MSGHSRWAGIKHRKAIVDARRGKLFSKLIRAVEVAAREGGGNPDANPTLSDAVQRAKDAEVGNDNIERAIKRGTGELEGVAYESFVYEGYGPGGVAILVEGLTDNRNRAAAEVRRIFTDGGGSLGEPGSVAWMFSRRGLIHVPKEAIDEEGLFDVAADSGADELIDEGETWAVFCPPGELQRLRKAIEDRDIEVASAQVTMEPSTEVPVEGPQAKQVLRLIEALEDSDDVQEVYANFDVPDEVLAEAAS